MASSSGAVPLSDESVLPYPERVWRVCKAVHVDLSGIGGEFVSGRWHTKRPGSRVLYCSADPSTAILEVLVNSLGDPRRIPSDLVLLTIRVPRDEFARAKARDEVIEESVLPVHWSTDVDGTRRIGDAWMERGESLTLIVPSALSPAPAKNVLLNPKHAAHEALRVEAMMPLAGKIAAALAGLRAALR